MGRAGCWRIVLRLSPPVQSSRGVDAARKDFIDEQSIAKATPNLCPRKPAQGQVEGAKPAASRESFEVALAAVVRAGAAWREVHERDANGSQGRRASELAS
jgi:hypothetical protein